MKRNKTYNILVIDDEQKICDIVKVFLSISKRFNNIVTANNAIEALTKMQNQKFDLLIVDQVMPGGKNGTELIQHISQMLCYSHIKYLLMSGCLIQKDVMLAMKMGITDIIVKPFNRDDLYAKTCKALKISK